LDSFQREILSYEALRSRADAFLAQYHPSGTIPVPIERIAEVQLGMDIVPVPGLRELLQSDDHGVESYITADLREIHVDEWVWRNRVHRYRFSLAHEIGHATLHRGMYENAQFTSINAWKAFIRTIPDDEYSWYEWQAYAFAGLVLVPSTPLRASVEKHVGDVTLRAERGGLTPADVWDALWDIALEGVAADFVVSTKVIEKRAEKENLRADFPPASRPR